MQKYDLSRRLSEAAREVSKSNILVQTKFFKNHYDIIEDSSSLRSLEARFHYRRSIQGTHETNHSLDSLSHF